MEWFTCGPFQKEKTEREKTESDVIRKYEDRYHVRQKLTKRELEILKLVAQAKSNKEIAGELYISDQTVGVHKKNIMRKLNVRSTLSLIKYATEQNLVWFLAFMQKIKLYRHNSPLVAMYLSLNSIIALNSKLELNKNNVSN